MRRLPPVFILCALFACSTPAIQLSPVYQIGSVRTYVLDAESRTTTEVGDVIETHRERLRARSTIEVLKSDATEAHLRVTITPMSSLVDGKKEAPPAEQVAEIAVAADGTLVKIETVGGLPPEVSGASVEDIAPLLGAPLPAQPLALGRGWHRRLPIRTGANAPTTFQDQRGRIEALRRLGSYDCAIVSLATQKPVARDEGDATQAVRFQGIEFSTVELAFAFRRGFPVRIDTHSEARLTVSQGSIEGTLTIASHSVLDLRSAR